MEKQLIKVLCLFSLTIGAMLGLIPLIPSLTGLAFFTLMFLISPIVLIHFYKLNLIKDFNEMEKSLTIGAISGATACIGFTVVYLPLALLLQLIFKIEAFIWIKVLFVNFGFLIPIIILIALIGALFNAFSAFLVAYFFTYFKQNK